MTGVTVVCLMQHREKEPGDPGLTGLGRMQATWTGRWLGGLGVGALWTSPMPRARETAVRHHHRRRPEPGDDRIGVAPAVSAAHL